MVELMLGIAQAIMSPEVVKSFVQYGIPAGIIVLGWAFNTKYLKVVFINRFENLENLVQNNTDIVNKIGKLTEFRERLQDVYQNALKQVNDNKLKMIFNYTYEQVVGFAGEYSHGQFNKIATEKVNTAIDYAINEARKKTFEIFHGDIDFVNQYFEIVRVVPGNKFRDKMLEILEDNFNNKSRKFERAAISFMEDTFSLFSRYWTIYLINKARGE